MGLSPSRSAASSTSRGKASKNGFRSHTTNGRLRTADADSDGEKRVRKMQRFHHDVERQDQRRRRDHARDENRPENEARPGEWIARESVCRRTTEHQAEDDDRDRHDDRIDRQQTEVELREELREIGQRECLRQESRWNLVDLMIRLECAQYHPDDGQKCEQRDESQNGDAAGGIAHEVLWRPSAVGLADSWREGSRR